MIGVCSCLVLHRHNSLSFRPEAHISTIKCLEDGTMLTLEEVRVTSTGVPINFEFRGS